MATIRHTYPSVFMLLILPFGVMGGYLSVCVAWQLSRAGLTVEQVALLLAGDLIPHTWKLAWAPIADSV